MRVALAALLLASSGCMLPLVAAAPQSATTVGRGGFGGTAYAEFPSVNLTAAPGGGGLESSDAVSLGVSGVIQFAYGVSDRVDLEAGVEGMLYLFFVPIPTGAHLGARAQLLDAPAWDVAVAARVGYAAFSGTAFEREQSVRAFTGMVSGVAQYGGLGAFRPSLSLSLYPSIVTYDATGVGQGTIAAGTGAATLNLTFDLGTFEVTPFLGGLVFTSPRLGGVATLGQVGLALALRPQKESERARAAPPATAADTR